MVNAPKQHFLETHEVSHGTKAMTPDSRATLLNLLKSEGITLNVKDLESAVKTEVTNARREIVTLSGQKDVDQLFDDKTEGINTVFSASASPKVKKDDIEKTLKGEMKTVDWYRTLDKDKKLEVIKKLVIYVEALRKQEKHNDTIRQQKKVPAHTICKKVLEKGLKLYHGKTAAEKLAFIQKVALAFGDLADAKTIASAVDALEENGVKTMDVFIRDATESLHKQKFQSPKINAANTEQIGAEYRNELRKYQTSLAPETNRFIQLYVDGKGKSTAAEQYLKLAKEKTDDVGKYRDMINDDNAFTSQITTAIAEEEDEEKKRIKKDVQRHRELATKRAAMETKREAMRKLIDSLASQSSDIAQSRFALQHHASLIPKLALIQRHSRKALVGIGAGMAIGGSLKIAGYSALVATGVSVATVGTGAAVLGSVLLAKEGYKQFQEWNKDKINTTVRLSSYIPGGLTVARYINNTVAWIEQKFQIPAGTAEYTLQTNLEKRERYWLEQTELVNKNFTTANIEMTLAKVRGNPDEVAMVRRRQQGLAVQLARVKSYYALVKKELDATKDLIDTIKGAREDTKLNQTSQAIHQTVEKHHSGGLAGFEASLDIGEQRTMSELKEVMQSKNDLITKPYETTDVGREAFPTNPRIALMEDSIKQLRGKWLQISRDKKIDPTDGTAIMAMTIMKEGLIKNLNHNDPQQQQDLLRLSYNITNSTSSLF